MTKASAPARRELPGGTFLAYVVHHAATYARAVDAPSVSVQASHPDGGCRWSFVVEEARIEGHPFYVRVFADGLLAFAEIPDFFAALGRHEPTTLDGVVAHLIACGATDMTEYPRGGDAR